MKELNETQRALIDELGECQERIAKVDPDVARAKVIKEQINTWIKDESAEKPVVLRGNVFESVAGVRKKERKIVAMDEIFAILGRAKFISLCTFPLGILDKVIPGKKEGLVIEDRTGPRQIETVRSVAAAVPLKKAA